jgi:ribosomal protein S27AE
MASWPEPKVEEPIILDLPEVKEELTTEMALRQSILDPCLFASKWLGVDAWPLMADIMTAVVDHRKVAVKACHASSKTFTAAVLTLWALAAHQEVIVITTAPTLNQVEKLLWAEVHALKARSLYPFPEATTRQLKFDSKRYAFGFTTSVTGGDEGVKFQGFHSEYILVILDEAPGIDGKIWEALEGILASGNVHVLALGNPTIASGPFYDAFGRNSEQWKSFTISAFNNPNFDGCKLSYMGADKEGNPKLITFGDPNGKDLLDMTEAELEIAPTPYLCSRRWVHDRFLEWGPEDPRFQARCLGAFPSQSPGALISLAWLESSRGEYKPRATDTLRAGVDVAGPGEAETVLTISYGMHIMAIYAWANQDPRGQIVTALRETERETGLRFENINFDTCGIGYYMARHIESEGFRVSDINVGLPAADVQRYANQKAEAYWGLRMMFSDGDITGLNDDIAFSQLTGIRYDTNARGQIVIESKDDARSRGVKALAVDTPIATPDGWTSMGKLKVGDFVFGSDGRPTRVKAVTVPVRGMPCYLVSFDAGEPIVAEAGHLWVTRQKNFAEEKGWRFGVKRGTRLKNDSPKTTRYLMDSLLLNRPSKGEGHYAYNHHIPISPALDLPEKELPISPYVLGYWLGDGDSDSPRLTIGDQDAEEIIAIIEKEGVKISKSARRYLGYKLGEDDRIGGLKGNGLRARLKNLGILDNKHIPLVYLRASKAQRLALLQGLLDSDGTIEDGRGRIAISSSYPLLVASIRELLWSLGIKSSEKKYSPYIGQTWVRFSFIAYAGRPVFRLKRKLLRQPPRPLKNSAQSGSRAVVGVEPVTSVPVRCISVEAEDGLFMAGRDLVLTHNSPDRAEAIMLCFANSKMHGLIEFWAAQARAVKANAGAAQIGKKQAPSLAESQKKAAENDSPWIGAKVKTLQGKTGLNGLAKVVTTPQQSSCPNCGNPGLSRYGDSQWACRPCGFSGQGTDVVFNEKGERQ